MRRLIIVLALVLLLTACARVAPLITVQLNSP